MKGKHVINDQYEYRTDDVLGSGTFGEVFKGQTIATQQIVAIKVIDKSKLKKFGQGIIVAIGNEVTILQKIAYSIDSPYIVKIYACFETESKIYIVTSYQIIIIYNYKILEFCDGGNLQDIIDKRKLLPEAEAKGIIYQVVQALNLLSENNIAHRDMKPENIFIKDGVFKLGDFGFASEKQMFETTCGTYPFMAPEMFEDDNYTNKVDIWALGIIYHWMLFGYHYFYNYQENQASVRKNILTREYVIPITQVISNESKEFLHLCMKKNPNERATANQLLNLKLFAGMSPLQSKILRDNNNKTNNVFVSEYQTPQGPSQNSQFNIPQMSLPPCNPSPNFDSILDKIMNYRNGIFFLEELAETLTQTFIDETRFLIFYLLNKAMKLLEALKTAIKNSQCPKGIIGNEPFWQEFLGNEQCRKLTLYLENDYIALNSLYDQYLTEIDQFIDKNYKQQANCIKAIINKDLTVDLSSIANQEIQCKQQYFISKGMKNNQPNLFSIAYNLFLVEQFEEIIKKQFNFEKYSDSKERLQPNDYKILFDKKDYAQFISL